MNADEKVRIILMNDSKKSYSKVIDRIYREFIQDFSQDYYIEDVLDVIKLAWNVSRIGKAIPEEGSNVRNDLMSGEYGTSGDALLLRKIVEFIDANFDSYENFIEQATYEEVGAEGNVKVIHAPLETFLSNPKKFIDVAGSEEFGEFDFEETYIDRGVIFLKRKQPFFDWCHKVAPDLELENDDELLRGMVYLVGDSENYEQLEKWIAKNSTKFLCSSLRRYIPIKKNGPKRGITKCSKSGLMWF